MNQKSDDDRGSACIALLSAMSRQNLRPIFKHLPRFILVVTVACIGLPLHVAMGVWSGLKDGLGSWVSEVKSVWTINDRPRVTKELVRSRIRQNRSR